ncbi:hypothetical protein SAY86_018957 [Trapa natans]|uniref:Uncharacterized protein n=1 Tax=Trapa natans TaxID=22666 RepID=A0AAN7LHV7_TRANT|nr:hypothetical protein SAY86_018957 [Trapa natans]
MLSLTKRASAGILVMLMVSQILFASSVRGEVLAQQPAPAPAPTKVTYKIQSLQFNVGIPFYRVRNSPGVLIPWNKVKERYIDKNNP